MNTHTIILFFVSAVIYVTHPICWDDNGQAPDWDYWWQVSKEEEAKNKYKERSIKRILHHCGDMINLVSEVNGPCGKECLGRYKVKTLTYKDTDGRRVSYDKKVPARN